MMLYKAKDFYYKNNEDREFDLFFVWRNKSIYIMDNHRAALWCWVNELNTTPKIKLSMLHIDNHPDMSPAGLHCTCANKIDFDNLTLNGYLRLKHSLNEKHSFGEADEQVFSYQNFLRYFVQKYPNVIDPTDVFITQHHWEKKPNIDTKLKLFWSKYTYDTEKSSDCSQLAKRLYKDDLIKLFEEDQHSRWIVDLDFDYFYNEKSGKLNIKLAEEVIRHIKGWYDKDKILSLTVAWSPEFLINRKSETIEIGLKEAKRLNSIFCKILKINDFKI